MMEWYLWLLAVCAVQGAWLTILWFFLHDRPKRRKIRGVRIRPDPGDEESWSEALPAPPRAEEIGQAREEVTE